MSVMAETSHSAMGPYVAIAAVESALYARTAVCRKPLVVKVCEAAGLGLVGGGDGDGGAGLGLGLGGGGEGEGDGGGDEGDGDDGLGDGGGGEGGGGGLGEGGSGLGGGGDGDGWLGGGGFGEGGGQNWQQLSPASRPSASTKFGLPPPMWVRRMAQSKPRLVRQ